MRSDPLAKSKLRPNVRPRCPQATRMCGVVMVMGLPAKDVTLPLVNAAIREVDIRGVFRYVNW